MCPELAAHASDAASVESIPGGYCLSLAGGQAGTYRLAQLDDYSHLTRRDLPWSPPVSLQLRARVSSAAIPGTWGFGFWNDPFSLSLGLASAVRRLPALPDAAWFFGAGESNYLSFRDDRPACGFLAQGFTARPLPPPLLALGALAAPGLVFRPLARCLRRLVRRLVHEDGTRLDHDVTAWHRYQLVWERDGLSFQVDDLPVFTTRVAPQARLGLVIWLDNQYAAWRPDGSVSAGTLDHPPAWLEVTELSAG